VASQGVQRGQYIHNYYYNFLFKICQALKEKKKKDFFFFKKILKKKLKK